MTLAVRKSPSVVVSPSEPVTMSGTIKLSSYDKGLDKVSATSLLLFEHPIHEAAETIKRALSQALVHYYPIAGRIAEGADDEEVYIQCNGEGVAFVAASTNHALKEEVICFDRSPGARKLLDQLAVYYPAKGCGPSDPLLLMQVTEFSCGGFVLGVTWNHAIADGTGMAQFLQAIGELAGGSSSLSIAPVRWDDSLPSLPLSIVAIQQHMLSLDHMDDLACLDITVPSRLINRIKADYGSRFNGQQCTMFEAVLAVLWQCRTRAINSDPEIPVLLSFMVNVRKHMGAKEGYYGNCTFEQLVMATSGTVANGGVMDVVKMIKHAKDQIPDRLKKNEGGNKSQVIGPQQLGNLLTYDMLFVTSWRNLGFDEVDFGSGRPARVTTSGQEMPPVPAAMCLLYNGKDGVHVLSGFVKEEHANAFLGELARFM